MSWSYHQHQQFAFPANHFVHDGNWTWAFQNDGTYNIFDYWNTEDKEFLDPDWYYSTGKVTHELKSRLWEGEDNEVGVSVVNAVRYYDHIWIQSSSSLVSINTRTRLKCGYPFPITPPSSSTTVQFAPTTCVAGSKMWFIEKQPPDFNRTMQSRIWWFDLITKEWGYRGIPGTFSSGDQAVFDGKLGNVLVTSSATFSVIEFDAQTTEFVRQRTIGTEPVNGYTNENGVAYITTGKNAIYSYSQSDNLVSNFAFAKGAPAQVLDDEQGFLFYINGTNPFARLRKSNKDLKFVPTPPEIASPGFTLTMPAGVSSKAIITPRLTVQEYDGTSFTTRTIRPYLFWSNGTNTYAVRLVSLARVNSAEARGTSMIVVGPNNYRGD